MKVFDHRVEIPRVIIAVVLCLTSVAGVSAQTEQTEEEKPALRAGSWALQFRIANDFTLSSFQGAVVSMQRHSSERSAWRFGLGLRATYQDDDAGRVFTSNDTLIDVDSSNEKLWSSRIDIDLQYVRYPNPDSRIKLFFGGGPLFVFSYDERERTVSSSSYNYTEAKSFGAGLSGLMGAAWFFTGSMSLHAEYGAELLYTWAKSDGLVSAPGVRSDLDSDSKRLDFRARSVLFGLSLYF